MDINSDKTLQIIKKVVQDVLNREGIRLHEVILFGSRARGDNLEDSDWDLLVVIEQEIVTREQRLKLSHLIRRELAEQYIPCDVLIKSKKEIDERKQVIGSVVRSAIQEGISL